LLLARAGIVSGRACHANDGELHVPSVFVTGANRGLGLEFVRQYSADGWQVLAACRAPDEAGALKEIAAASGGKTTLHAIDVADRAGVLDLAASIETPIDILINNAGQMEPWDEGFGAIDYDKWDRILRTNLFGPAWVSHAFAPHVAKSDRRLIAMMTSGLGSLADNRDGARNPAGKLYMYRSSKAGLNMLVSKLAADLKDRGIAVIAMGPGHVQTDMGGPTAQLKPAESIGAVRDVLAARTLEDTGRYFFYTGDEYPW
jgi:NAD(P)-dependent dehydrogenase (short-subunit alcohol dehydrogenase family)